MRISDWSSDVCSSDLRHRRTAGRGDEAALAPHRRLLVSARGDSDRRVLADGGGACRYLDSGAGCAGISRARVTSRAHFPSRSTRIFLLHCTIYATMLNGNRWARSEEHTSELQSLMRISYAVFCLKTKKKRRRTAKNNK